MFSKSDNYRYLKFFTVLKFLKWFFLFRYSHSQLWSFFSANPTVSYQPESFFKKMTFVTFGSSKIQIPILATYTLNRSNCIFVSGFVHFLIRSNLNGLHRLGGGNLTVTFRVFSF